MMSNEAKLTILKRCTKSGEVLRDVPINAPPEDKLMTVRNVFNSRHTVELQIGELRIEVNARDLNVAIANATSVMG